MEANIFPEVHITSAPIDYSSIHQLTPESMSFGAIVSFFGTVRNQTNERKVAGLLYEAHVELAQKMMKQIQYEAIDRFELLAARSCHRIGYVKPGETAVAVITYGAHRKEAYEANMYIIDRIKFEVPIWKKEFFEDGSANWTPN